MNSRNGANAASLLALALVGALPLAAQAQSAGDAWKWNATIYGWFPAFGGSTSFPATGSGPSIDVSTQDVLDALKMAFMGSLEAKKGKWGLWTDLVYADFGGDKSGSRDFTIGHGQIPVGVSANLDLDMKNWIWSTAGLYSLADKPEGTADLLFGARMLDMDQTLNWSITGTIPGLPPAAQSGTATASLNNWDAIVGVKGRIRLGPDGKWFIPYYLDIGTGESRFTWQGIAGIGYQFGWGSVIAAWRYLDYDFKSGGVVESLNMNGGAIGVQFSF
jgi:hypothetical protein